MQRRSSTAIVIALALLGCSGGGTPQGTGSTSTSSGTGGAAGTSGTGTGGAGTGGATSGSCDPDPLHTGLTAMQTGISVDAFDCEILKWAAYYKEPDPMIFKAIIYVESRFDDTAVACPNLPCGTPSGWTVAESGCYGLMQVVPACGDDPNGVGLLPSGQPNLTTAPSAAGWAGSIFNPDVNIETGISGVAGNRAQVEKQFADCTVDQYTLMAVGNYNMYMSATSCTQYNTAYTGPVVTAYHQYAAAAGYPAHAY
jgi:Transglycosylase SLT domain